MSVDIKLGNDTINGVNYLKVKNANNPNELITFAPTPFDLNIHYSSTTPPEDTSKLWVKTDTIPTKVILKKDLQIDIPDELNELATNPSYGSYYTSLDKSTWNTYYFKQPASSVMGLYYSNVHNSNPETTLIRYSWNNSSSWKVSQTTYNNYVYYTIPSGQNIYLYKIDLSASTIGHIQVDSYGTSNNNGVDGIFIINNLLYVITSYFDYSTSRSKATCNIYNPETDTLINTISFSLKWSPRMEVLGDNIYFFTGRTKGTPLEESDFIYKLDTNLLSVTKTNTEIPKINGNRGTIGSAVLGNKIILSVSSDTEINFYEYDTLTDTLTLKLQKTGSGYSNYRVMYIEDNFLYASMNLRAYRTPISTPLEENHLLVLEQLSKKGFVYASSDSVEIYCYTHSVYLGDSNNEAQKVDAALYNSSTQTWENI